MVSALIMVHPKDVLHFHFLHLPPCPSGFVSLFSWKQVITTARAKPLNHTLAFCLAQWLLFLCRCCYHCIHAPWHLYQRCHRYLKPSKSYEQNQHFVIISTQPLYFIIETENELEMEPAHLFPGHQDPNNHTETILITTLFGQWL